MRHVVGFVGPSPKSLTAIVVRLAWPSTTHRQGEASTQVEQVSSHAEIISMRDRLVSGTVVAVPPLAATGGLTNGGW